MEQPFWRSVCLNILKDPIIPLLDIYYKDAHLGGKVLAVISKSCKHSINYHLSMGHNTMAH